jgi:hypothetical protein
MKKPKERFQAYVESELFQKCKTYCEKKEITMSALIEDLLSKFFDIPINNEEINVILILEKINSLEDRIFKLESKKELELESKEELESEEGLKSGEELEFKKELKLESGQGPRSKEELESIEELELESIEELESEEELESIEELELESMEQLEFIEELELESKKELESKEELESVEELELESKGNIIPENCSKKITETIVAEYTIEGKLKGYFYKGGKIGLEKDKAQIYKRYDSAQRAVNKLLVYSSDRIFRILPKN